jgi:hypothetical protein
MTAEVGTTITTIETSVLELNENINNNSITIETLETTIENEQNGVETETIPPDEFTGNLLNLLEIAA